MDPPPKPSSSSQSHFQVFLRLRPPLDSYNGHYTPQESPTERFIIVEPPSSPTEEHPFSDVIPSSTHITLQPPTDSRKRAVEKFAFTKVFEEYASQLDLFTETGVVGLVRGVLGGEGGADGLVATLGVTGSGKSHTILGSKSHRGLTQMSLAMLFQSLDPTVYSSTAADPNFMASLSRSDPSEAQLIPALDFLESTYGDTLRGIGSWGQTPMSRAQTPMTVWHPQRTESPIQPPSPFSPRFHPSSIGLYPKLLGLSTGATPPRGKDVVVTPTIRMVEPTAPVSPVKRLLRSMTSASNRTSETHVTRSTAKRTGNAKDVSIQTNLPRRHGPAPRPSLLPQTPDVIEFALEVDPEAEYSVLVSMYEVYNDRIFDLLSSASAPTTAAGMTARQGTMHQKDTRRRPLLFKSTEASPDRKVVAGLRKIVCGSYEEAIMVLETGLQERRVAGTGSNSVSSRSHGFFCVEVKKKVPSRRYGGEDSWDSKTLTIVDLAGSERARNAKTAGATLAEAGKINESLMYLGQCLQLQSDTQSGANTIVPYRQCKLTELLFHNSFASPSRSHSTPQKALMIVTADPLGDFNATSQILRYSALAREVTVPRIPSVTSTIFSGGAHINAAGKNPSGRTTPYLAGMEELELAAAEIARLSEECDLLAVRCTEEEIRANEAELKLRNAEERAERVEVEIREEVWGEVEQKFGEERRRWMNIRDEDREMNEGYVDKKLELLTKTVATVQIHEDPEPSKDERADELEHENDALKLRIANLERELQARSPTKLKSRKPGPFNPTGPGADENIPLKLIGLTDSGDEGTSFRMAGRMSVLRTGDGNGDAGAIKAETPSKAKSTKTPVRSPSKKVRKLTTRKWDLGPEEEIP